MKADWIAVDWGTSRLRAWAMQGETVLAEASSTNGMGRLSQDAFEPALLNLVEDWLEGGPIDVVACGMVGARQGWVEAPYSAVPVSPFPERLFQVQGTDPRLRVYVVPGLKQERPADAMRGEETQVAGFLARHENWDGVVCLPGIHTKWAHVSANEVVSFQTFMTGEMFDLLSEASVLRHSVGEGGDQEAFVDALGDSMSRPESLAARLFGLRAQDLLHGQSKATARARLSGYLIGAELAAARPYWLGQKVALIGASGLAGHYAAALKLQGVPAQVFERDEMTLAGLAAAHASLVDRK
ncbi:2-dehydro-3-deoxygalactonokinase [uncultured Shimia sp.]|uniref:2-dehydro-3-deoxygalactonokinase n=1 Tax=uncultured Shimia sp. TaxID=573152 RepID=UPI002626C260|nr:2-dehydro-3-deoxygalactonokinase [uncultured Shimia sp.]